MALTQAQINAQRAILDAQWKAKDAERTASILQKQVETQLTIQTSLIEKQQADAFNALKKQNDLSVANYKNSAIIDSINSRKVNQETFASVNDSIKANAINVGQIRAAHAGSGFDVNTGSSLQDQLQQSIESTFQQQDIVQSGAKVAGVLTKAANDKVAQANQLKADFSFLYDSLKPKSSGSSFTFNR